MVGMKLRKRMEMQIGDSRKERRLLVLHNAAFCFLYLDNLYKLAVLEAPRHRSHMHTGIYKR